ncbi:DUF4265 domain-containing protein [Asanoa iriomotensis]|uniref:DUF4265 domain-containing protein n=1 Tax=Asanoa iriomotensis TaxID=234613 RepID=UPI001EF3A1C4|nr:DUF4265 domain-containing protein [Asanoa iriomotensis]
MAPDRTTRDGQGMVKIMFRFVPREGWLPYDTEGLWARLVTADTARVANVPFLQDGVAEGDVVRFTTDDDGVRWSVERVEASGNCTIRVLPLPDGPLGRSARAVHEKFAPFGLGGETFSAEFPFVALTVPADTDLGAVKVLLESGETEGWWAFEEGCITDAWRDA